MSLLVCEGCVFGVAPTRALTRTNSRLSTPAAAAAPLGRRRRLRLRAPRHSRCWLSNAARHCTLVPTAYSACSLLVCGVSCVTSQQAVTRAQQLSHLSLEGGCVGSVAVEPARSAPSLSARATHTRHTQHRAHHNTQLPPPATTCQPARGRSWTRPVRRPCGRPPPYGCKHASSGTRGREREREREAHSMRWCARTREGSTQVGLLGLNNCVKEVICFSWCVVSCVWRSKGGGGGARCVYFL
jgi:hypothetical protein